MMIFNDEVSACLLRPPEPDLALICPLMIEVRVGVQVGFEQYAWVNTVPPYGKPVEVGRLHLAVEVSQDIPMLLVRGDEQDVGSFLVHVDCSLPEYIYWHILEE